MNAPRRPDGPPVRDGKPYSAIAHLAEDIVPYVALSAGLRDLGLSAPEILHADLDHGLLAMEDFGDEHIVAGDPPAPVEERYGAAIDLLAALHGRELPQTLPVTPEHDYRLPPYDLDGLPDRGRTAARLVSGRAPSAAADGRRVTAFIALWREALAPALAAPPTWVLRDYHSPNLMWLPQRDGIARIGLLDFQDALIGSAAYDVASLLQDARVDVAGSDGNGAARAATSRARYGKDRDFDPRTSRCVYATLAAQRATKILGIFARLDRRDGKPQYLRHMPRLWNYLQRSLAHPALASLKAWYAANVPAPDGL